MKPQNFSLSGDNTLISESKASIGERLKEACAAAMVAVESTTPKATEQKLGNWSREDPIRVMMFLGSWSHT
ncbi:hypothetical protein SLE2022_243680 [Rubroshorea leprosula]